MRGCDVDAVLRVLEGFEEAHVKYIDSPQTRAQLDRVSKAHHGSFDDEITHSPLKIGDDFGAMARKLLPFGKMPSDESAPAPARVKAMMGEVRMRRKMASSRRMKRSAVSRMRGPR